MKKIKVIELFAGVGGFHVGFDNANKELKLDKDSGYDVIWANQWEPSTKKQHAFEILKTKFEKSINEHSNKDIHEVKTKDIEDFDLMVGGFPCQDYSVARTLSQARGLEGKKGVLWWQIKRILEEKGDKSPKFLMLENVDRLLKSPAKQRGRDFAIMLSSLDKLGYAVEWRVVNAADYGMPQRRRRTYILGYKRGTSIYDKMVISNPKTWIEKDSIFSKAFPIENLNKVSSFEIDRDLEIITNNFNKGGGKSLFEVSGIMVNRKVATTKITPKYHGKRIVLRDILTDENKVPSDFVIDKNDFAKWKYLKGAKNEKRATKTGFEYIYTEGPMVFPDSLDKPSRTIVTGEGGPTPSRFKHVIVTDSGKMRRLVPEELERLNMFPDGHTSTEPSAIRRAFFMGNALVTGIVTKLGVELYKAINQEDSAVVPQKAID